MQPGILYKPERLERQGISGWREGEMGERGIGDEIDRRLRGMGVVCRLRLLRGVDVHVVDRGCRAASGSKYGNQRSWRTSRGMEARIGGGKKRREKGRRRERKAMKAGKGANRWDWRV